MAVTIEKKEPTTAGHPGNGHAVNGHVNGKRVKNGNMTTKKENVSTEESATKVFAEFVVNTTIDAVTPELATKVKALLLDYFGVSAAAGFAADSTPKFLTGMTAFAAGAQGTSTVFTKGSTFLPQYAALLNGALCHSYDFDDTHGPAILHPGASCISAALAEAELLDSTGSDLLLALIVGYEVSCRIGIAIGNGSYAHGFHNTGTAGIFGSIAAVCKLRKSSQTVIENAFGLGVSKAAGSMQFLENGSWNKRLHPGFAAHDALLCLALAEAGVVGAAKPIEGKYGALHNFSGNPDPSALTTDLGSVWQLLGTACKPFPACRMTHGQLEMVGELRKRHADKGTPKHIQITLPPANFPIVGTPTPNKIHPVTIVDAQFSSYFQTAAAWLHGNMLGWTVYDKITDEAVLDLCSRISCDIDHEYKNLESKLVVTFEDGTVVEEEVVYPLAEPQKPFEWDTGVQTKFLGLAVPVYGEEKCREICGMVELVEDVDVVDLMRLLA